MHYHLPHYQHGTGRHCGSGSLVNLCRYEGFPVSEPMVIGLGAALGFGYFTARGFSPSRVFFPRNTSLEADFCENAGIGFQMHKEQDHEKAWEEAKKALLTGHPVMLNSDIFELKYFGSSTHFNGHKTLLVGFDDEKQEAIISDTEFPEEKTEPLESLARARASRYPPLLDGGSPWFTLEFPPQLAPLPEAIRKAIRLQARRMLDVAAPLGVAGLFQAARDLPHWKEAEDWKWCARFSYQIIERRGTGGAAFRKMYGEFLGESRAHAPEIDDAGLCEKMNLIVSLWEKLAAQLKAQSEMEADPAFVEAAKLMGELAINEKAFFEHALRAFPA